MLLDEGPNGSYKLGKTLQFASLEVVTDTVHSYSIPMHVIYALAIDLICVIIQAV